MQLNITDLIQFAGVAVALLVALMRQPSERAGTAAVWQQMADKCAARISALEDHIDRLDLFIDTLITILRDQGVDTSKLKRPARQSVDE